MRWFLPVLLALCELGAQTPKVKAWVGVKPQTWEYQAAKPFGSEREPFRTPLFLARSGLVAKKDRTPGAVVEVWGDASWARQDEFKAFLRANLPAFHNAFDAGLASSIGGQMLSELMFHGGELHRNPAPAFAPSVWYNAQDPWARDRRYFK